MTQQPTPDQIKALARTKRFVDDLATAMRKAVAEPTLTHGMPYDRDHWWRLRRHTWWIARTAPGEKPVRVAEGRHLTARGAVKAWDRAYGAELDRLAGLAKDAAEGVNRKRDIETSRDANRWKPGVN